jgi:hypothetical protein
MTSQPPDQPQQPPDQPWQAPQNLWQQPPYGASPYGALPQPLQPPQLPKQAGRGLGCAITAIVGVVALIVIGGVIFGGVAAYHAYKNASTNTHARSATSSATKPKPQLQTVAGLNGLLTDIRNHFGDTMGYELSLEPDDATLIRADPSNSRHDQIYYYNGAWDSGSTGNAFGSLADLGKFDVAAVLAQLTSAPQLLGITDVKKITLAIRGNADGSVTPRISVDDQTASGGDASIDLNPDGSVKALHPGS